VLTAINLLMSLSGHPVDTRMYPRQLPHRRTVGTSCRRMVDALLCIRRLPQRRTVGYPVDGVWHILWTI